MGRRIGAGRWFALVALPLLLAAIAGGCGGGSTASTSTLGIATWNVRWLGATGRGPTDEVLQAANACALISEADLDVWALQEVVSATSFAWLLACLPDHDGVLSDDPAVAGGAEAFGPRDLKLALLWKRSVASLREARIVLAESAHDFGGRPPLEVRLEVALGGATGERTFVVVHAKALADLASWQRRANGSVALKAHLDAHGPGRKVIALGDLNDDLDTSIAAGQASPYQNFLSDPARYDIPSWSLTRSRIATTCWLPGAVDHQIVTRAQGDDLVAGSVASYRPGDGIADYCRTTSDHYPTIARYAFPGAASP